MAPRRRIGIVDDDAKLTGLIIKFLGQNGFGDVQSVTPERIMAGQVDCDLFILDVMMPGIDGYAVCREIRRRWPVALVIFLSAKAEAIDRVLGLELGADDYLTKPFESRELLARIHALFRRRDLAGLPQTGGEGTVRFAGGELDLDRQCVRREGQVIPLTTYEFSLLRLLVRHAGMVLTRDQIIRLLERDEFYSCDRSVDIGISRLRKKIEPDPRQPTVILTVWGRGYQLAAGPPAVAGASIR